MATKLIGATTNGNTGLVVNYCWFAKYTAIKSDLCNLLRAYCLVNSNVRMALFADSAGLIGANLGESASLPAIAGDYRDIVIPSIQIILGTDYWIGFQNETAGGGSYQVLPGTYGYITPFAYGPFPATGAGASYATGVEIALQGWNVPAGGFFMFF
jgi:hypothetical protein